MILQNIAEIAKKNYIYYPELIIIKISNQESIKKLQKAKIALSLLTIGLILV